MADNKLCALLMMVLASNLWEQLMTVEGSKIAYKKPLYGKTSYFKDRRYKLRPTSEPTTVDEDWPASVEFIINTSPRTSITPEMEMSTVSGSTVEPVELGSGSGSGSSSSSYITTTTTTTTTESNLDNTLPSPPTPAGTVKPPNQPVPCTCGVFLSSQIKNGIPETPLIHNEMDRMYASNAIGRKQCQTKCLEAIVQHLPNSANIVCATLGHDCHKERAYLFIKNYHNQWLNTNLQAGREYCCKDGVPYRCPLIG